MSNETGSKALLELSKATEVDVRKMVAYGFKFYAESLSTDFLKQQLEDQDPALLIYSIQSIAQLKSMKAAEVLLNEKFSTHENVKVRRAVIKAFVQLAGSFSQKQQGLLISLLGARLEGDQDLTVRIQSALALGNVKLDTAIDILTPNAQSENQKLKFAILQAFVNHNTVGSVKSLELILEDKDDQIREKALTYIGKISNAEAKAELKNILNKRLSKETVAKIKSDIEALLKSL
jgi:HEAT repeat protein